MLHGNCTRTVLLAVVSPVGTMHLPEFASTRLKVFVAPDTVTGWRVTCWFVAPLQVSCCTAALSAVDDPATPTHSPANEVTV
ncbi:hypothetical protein Raf01_61940 [Rugosimonospora africana]|uniref:Uncharacterized protein n=1 Tax=Rugosimonospora africana TaxID=556532 RepID=A0A8J3QXM7_9ACTN|nr:hypothetical protein Raf01_61940 [Rugosimonospora africana]